MKKMYAAPWMEIVGFATEDILKNSEEDGEDGSSEWTPNL